MKIQYLEIVIFANKFLFQQCLVRQLQIHINQHLIKKKKKIIQMKNKIFKK